MMLQNGLDDEETERRMASFSSIDTENKVVFSDNIKKLTDSDQRRLYAVVADPEQMSNQCKEKCIDKNFNFCSNSGGNGGFCCYADEECPKQSICSFDNKRAPKMFKYVSCPNEAACGKKNIYIDYDGSGSEVVRAVDKYNH
jgi:hypothetical protein